MKIWKKNVYMNMIYALPYDTVYTLFLKNDEISVEARIFLAKSSNYSIILNFFCGLSLTILIKIILIKSVYLYYISHPFSAPIFENASGNAFIRFYINVFFQIV